MRVEDTGKRLAGLVGGIGPESTIQYYREAFEPAGIRIVVPRPDERAYIHEKYMTELVSAVAKDETQRGLLAIADTMREREGIDGLVLGGTELSMILGGLPHTPVPFLDTTRIHADAIVERLLA
jgi:aspartate racemase